MTNRQQSAFFLAIVFLFTSGIGLVIYRQYDQYYQQNIATDLETAQTPSVSVKKPSASSTSDQISGWNIYKNAEYGFEFQYPGSWFFRSGEKFWNVQSIPFTENLHGVGEPPSGLWLDVSYGACNYTHNDYREDEAPLGSIDKIVCKNNLQITLSLYDNDPKKEDNEQILGVILNSFKFTK